MTTINLTIDGGNTQTFEAEGARTVNINVDTSKTPKQREVGWYHVEHHTPYDPTGVTQHCYFWSHNGWSRSPESKPFALHVTREAFVGKAGF